jgi:hypothetical protein
LQNAKDTIDERRRDMEQLRAQAEELQVRQAQLEQELEAARSAEAKSWAVDDVIRKVYAKRMAVERLKKSIDAQEQELIRREAETAEMGRVASEHEQRVQDITQRRKALETQRKQNDKKKVSLFAALARRDEGLRPLSGQRLKARQRREAAEQKQLRLDQTEFHIKREDDLAREKLQKDAAAAKMEAEEFERRWKAKKPTPHAEDQITSLLKKYAEDGAAIEDKLEKLADIVNQRKKEAEIGQVKRLAECRRRRGAAEEALAELRRTLEGQESFDDLQAQLAQVQREHDELVRSIQEKQEGLRALKEHRNGEIDERTREIRAEKERVAQAERDVNQEACNQITEEGELEREEDRLQQRTNRLATKIRQLQARWKSAKKMLETYQHNMDAEKRRCEQLRAQLRELESAPQ